MNCGSSPATAATFASVAVSEMDRYGYDKRLSTGIALFFALTILVWCSINPTLGPKGARSGWRERLAALPEVAWVLLVFVLIIGGLMKGFFTPTEAGSVGTFAVILLSVAQRGINFRGFAKSLTEALRIIPQLAALLPGLLMK